eukprot:g3249.t1
MLRLPSISSSGVTASSAAERSARRRRGSNGITTEKQEKYDAVLRNVLEKGKQIKPKNRLPTRAILEERGAWASSYLEAVYCACRDGYRDSFQPPSSSSSTWQHLPTTEDDPFQIFATCYAKQLKSMGLVDDMDEEDGTNSNLHTPLHRAPNKGLRTLRSDTVKQRQNRVRCGVRSSSLGETTSLLDTVHYIESRTKNDKIEMEDEKKRSTSRLLASIDFFENYIERCLGPSERGTTDLYRRILSQVKDSFVLKGENYNTSIPQTYVDAVAAAETVKALNETEKATMLEEATYLEKEMKRLKKRLDVSVESRFEFRDQVKKCEREKEKARLEFSTVQEGYIDTADEVKTLNRENEQMKNRSREFTKEREAGASRLDKLREDNADLTTQVNALSRRVERWEKIQELLNIEKKKRADMAADVEEQRLEEDKEWAIARARKRRLSKIDEYRRKHLHVLKERRKFARIESFSMGQHDKEKYREAVERVGLSFWDRMRHREEANRVTTMQGYEVRIKVGCARDLYCHVQDPEKMESSPFVRLTFPGHKKMEYKTGVARKSPLHLELAGLKAIESKKNNDFGNYALWNQYFVIYGNQIKVPLENFTIDFNIAHAEKRGVPMGTARIDLSKLVADAQLVWDKAAEKSLGIKDVEDEILRRKKLIEDEENARLQKLADEIDGVMSRATTAENEVDIDERMAMIEMKAEKRALEEAQKQIELDEKHGKAPMSPKSKGIKMGEVKDSIRSQSISRASYASGQGAGMAGVIAVAALRSSTANLRFESHCEKKGIEAAEKEWKDIVISPIRRVSDIRISASSSYTLCVLPSKGMPEPLPDVDNRWPKLDIEIELVGWRPIDQVFSEKLDKQGNRVLAPKGKAVKKLRAKALREHMTRLYAAARMRSLQEIDPTVCAGPNGKASWIEKWRERRNRNKPESREIARLTTEERIKAMLATQRESVPVHEEDNEVVITMMSEEKE